MPRPNLIVQDQFGLYYRLHRGWFIDAPIEPERFTDDYFAEQFVRDLRVDADDWIHILYEIDGKPRNTYNDNVYQDMAVLIVRGHMNVYRITHLDPFNLSHPAQGLNYPIIKDPQGASYHLVPTSLFLTHPLEGARFFKRDGTDAAQRFLDGLNLNDAQIQDIADSMSFFWWVRPRGGATPKSLRWHLGYALEQGEIGVVREAPAPAPTSRAAEPDVVSATGPGNRAATLGPHVGKIEKDDGVSALPVKAETLNGVEVTRVGKSIVVQGAPEYREKVVRDLKSIANTATGSHLLKSIDKSGRTIAIESPPGANSGNSVGYQSPVDRFLRSDGTPGNGTNSKVQYNADRTTIGTQPWETRPAAIGLAHELIHAEQAAYGTMSTGEVNNDSKPDPSDPTQIAKERAREVEAVGIPPNDKRPFTENKIRSEWNPPQSPRNWY